MKQTILVTLPVFLNQIFSHMVTINRNIYSHDNKKNKHTGSNQFIGFNKKKNMQRNCQKNSHYNTVLKK
ncbi:MAG: hypothetical protein ACOCWB_04085 [Bacteroidota bacterium]